MPRKPRISYPGALHHTIIRGNHKEKIFLYKRDREKFIDLIKEYQGQHSFKCYAYVLMENHVHLLIEENQIPLPKIMQGINQSYTQYFNVKYKKVGHLFQGRYKAILCDKDNYLLELVRYIHLNPVRALLVKKVEEYKWSSHNVYISKDDKSFIDCDFVLSLFAKTKKEAKKQYIKFIYDGIDEQVSLHFEKRQFHGDDDFIENVTKKFTHQCRNNTEISLDEIISIVIKRLRINKQHLLSRSRERRLSFARGVIGYLARETTDISIKDIGIYFNRDPSAVTHSIRRIMSQMKEDSDISDIIDEFKTRILKESNQNNSIIQA